VLFRPRGVPEGVSALVGAVLMLATGLLNRGDIGVVFEQNVSVFEFFLGMMTLTTLAEQAHVFDWVADLAARMAGGSPRRLFINVFIIGTIISTFLTNDATALILTPVVYALVTKLRLEPLPYVFACTFIADTASMTLPVSNPINMILVQRFGGLSLGDFLHFLFLPGLCAILFNIGAFSWIFRDSLRGMFPQPAPPEAASRGEQAAFRWAVVCLALVAIAFVCVSALQPAAIGIVAVAGAGALLLVTARLGRLEWHQLRQGISWGIFPFIAGMFLMVRGIEHQGATEQLGQLVARLAGQGTLRPAVVATAFGALGSNVINNVPMVAVMNSTIPTIHGASQHALVLGTLVGCDLGPNLTIVGSLSTMIWLLLLRQRGVEVSGLDYARLGIIVTPIMLLVAGVTLGLLLG
jgi:arsenical pump membrane protein